jgi:tryptophanyl-tRNA synthetase
MEKKRLLTGDRPTGKLHLGHYVGSIQNRVKLQDQYDSYIFVADLHMLTTKPSKEDIDKISDNARDIVLDYLACGIDPEKVTIYMQSAIHEIYELNLLFEMLVSVPRLERLPSLKDMARDAHLNEMPFGLLGYPVLQSADILLPRAHVVPVGKDNEAHVGTDPGNRPALQPPLRRGIPGPPNRSSVPQPSSAPTARQKCPRA